MWLKILAGIQLVSDYCGKVPALVKSVMAAIRQAAGEIVKAVALFLKK
jgi:hypothetical protein